MLLCFLMKVWKVYFGLRGVFFLKVDCGWGGVWVRGVGLVVNM